MQRHVTYLVLFVLIAAFPLACEPEPAEEAALEEEVEPELEEEAVEVPAGARVEVSRKAPFGEYLTDVEGVSLYMFTADSTGNSNCYDACAEAWPPLLTEDEPEAAPEVSAAMLSTIERRDGAMQVTYNGWPLYYYVEDEQPGDTEGQDVHGFGGEWYLVSPEGHPIEVEEDGES